jgi:tRNA (guanine-N7-)-methyltransferase
MTRQSPAERRGVRSFVLRGGRIGPGQKKALETLGPAFVLPYAGHALDLRAAFGRDAPMILEIGFGMGHTTAEIAAALPDRDFLGIEVHLPGVGSLLKEIGERRLTNIRIIRHDAVEVLKNMIPDRALGGVHLYFPDPWPKKRHHKRRLIQPSFVALLARKLETGGCLHCATDWEEYARQMLEVLSSSPDLQNTAPGFSSRPGWRPITKFERRGLGLGHGVWDLIFRKAPSPVLRNGLPVSPAA